MPIKITKRLSKVQGLIILAKKKIYLLLQKRNRLRHWPKEVIQGLWGNGEERKKRLTDAGYDYAGSAIKGQ